MDVLREILHALWQQDFSKLADPNVIWVIYGILFTTLFLENGLLPASFLPGDSLLLLAGALIAKGLWVSCHADHSDYRRQFRLLVKLSTRPLVG